MKTILNETVPADYAVCQCADCPKASTCLRQIAYSRLIDDETSTFLRLIKPRFCGKGANCRFYRDAEPVDFAQGFVNFQEHMFPRQYERFMSKLIAHFGRNAYFERRRGERLLPPEEQAVILKVLETVGVTDEMRFDSYVRKLYW